MTKPKAFQEVRLKYPELVQRFMAAGYRVMITRNAQVFARQGQVIHDGSRLFKNLKVKLEEDRDAQCEITVVFVNLTGVYGDGPEEYGISFCAEISLGDGSPVMLDKGFFISEAFSIENVEHMFSNVTRAIYGIC